MQRLYSRLRFSILNFRHKWNTSEMKTIGLLARFFLHEMSLFGARKSLNVKTFYHVKIYYIGFMQMRQLIRFRDDEYV
jgi:hypothetical protein